MAAKSVFLGIVCSLLAVHVHHAPFFGVRHDRHRSPLLAQAFSDGWSSRQQRHHSLSAPTWTSSSLSTRSSHPAFHSCRSFSSSIDVPCRNTLFKTGTRCNGKLLLICRSTVRDETAEAEVETAEETVIQINGVNGVNGANGANGHELISTNGVTRNGHQQPGNDTLNDTAVDDVPTPTANGGFTHTSTSRAKISAANKGKTPWNKGKARSEETKARIAEGVRRKNRERFLTKLAAEGVTEEEYHEKKKAERRIKDAERRARRTAKGGYTPTAETKKKISKILKEKYANGEMTRRPRDPSKVRRGFKHTEETKQKIRESLKRKWAEDDEYRELMTNKTVASGKVGRSVRKRISETLKKRWEDPEFRANMMEKFATRRASTGTGRDDSHRKKISDAMKKKWMDEEYRRRATEGMAKGRESAARDLARKAIPLQPQLPKSRPSTLKAMSPIRTATAIKSKSLSSTKAKKKKKKAATKRKISTATPVKPINKKSSSSPTTAIKARKKPSKKEQEAQQPDGSISRLREERRDLYDLLYGDEDDDDNNGDSSGDEDSDNNNGLSSGMMVAGASSNVMAALLADDDDLDDFDPYGLQHDTAPSAFKRE
ncbi:hypothetical protein ACHAXR_010585 [Thalassiosira sp. AJA248-18]